MGSLFRQQYKRRDGTTARTSKWYGEYRDHEGRRRRVPLARDKSAAMSMLSGLERRAELLPPMLDELRVDAQIGDRSGDRLHCRLKRARETEQRNMEIEFRKRLAVGDEV